MKRPVFSVQHNNLLHKIMLTIFYIFSSLDLHFFSISLLSESYMELRIATRHCPTLAQLANGFPTDHD